MSFRLRRLKEISRVLPHSYSGHCSRSSRRNLYTLSSHVNYLPRERVNSNQMVDFRDRNDQRYSTASKRSNKPHRELDFLTYIGSVIDEVEGPTHCWLNRADDQKSAIRNHRGFLVISGDFVGGSVESSCDLAHMIEKAKFLQQRYPWLQVLGFQYSKSVCSSAICAHLLPRIMAEFITFPVLVSNKRFAEMKCWPFYAVFIDLGAPLTYLEKDVDLSIVDKAVSELNVQHSDQMRLEDKLKGSWVNPTETYKEPHLPSSLRNLFFYFPGCISVDESGSRLFLSDANHHRIIVSDISGEILDSIGSSPGFEDGDFECAKLLRPAASFYHDDEDCLYFVDSENHSIRRADMERRVVETIYPTAIKKNSSLWSWVLDKIGMKRDAPQAKEITSESFLFPWHLIKSSENELYVLNRSFGSLWIVDMASSCIREFVKGPEKILEICGPMIMEKSLLLNQFPTDWLQQQGYNNYSLAGHPYAGLISSVAALEDHLFVCDTVAQMVLKLDSTSRTMSSLRFSKFGILGLPYWFSFPLEQVYSLATLPRRHIDHAESFCLLPGRVDIKLNIDIPQDTDLVEPLQDSCIWRQARGAAIEISGAERKAESSEKLGVAQQWYDELDNLAFSAPETESRIGEESTVPKGDVAEHRISIDCSIGTSPGVSEVIIYAVLYLKLKGNPDSDADNQVKKSTRLAELLNPIPSVSRDSLIHLLSKTSKDAEEFIFMRPLHVRLKFECGTHPKAENSKNVVLTDSSVEVNVSLR